MSSRWHRFPVISRLLIRVLYTLAALLEEVTQVRADSPKSLLHPSHFIKGSSQATTRLIKMAISITPIAVLREIQCRQAP